MLFISKMIRDPNAKFTPNGLGLTLGLTFHSTKRWSCYGYNHYTNQFYEMVYPKPVDPEQLEWKVQYKLWHDRNCGKRTKHVSYRGYMYWTGPKNRYTFRYAGPLRDDQVWWKPFSKRPHGRYTRLRDDGPQNPPPRTDELKKFRESPAWQEHRARFREAMKSYKVQCEEYERVRSADGRGAWKP